jgi:hypothetical protein
VGRGDVDDLDLVVCHQLEVGAVGSPDPDSVSELRS